VRHFLVKRLGSLPGMTEALERGITVADVGCGCTPVDANIPMACTSVRSQACGAVLAALAGAALYQAIRDRHGKSLMEHGYMHVASFLWLWSS
jgi:hypothetical protein